MMLTTLHTVSAQCRKRSPAQRTVPHSSNCRQERTVTARFMRSGTSSDSHQQGQQESSSNAQLDLLPSLDEAMISMATMSQHARDSLGWLRHALQDPDDFSASAIGRMVSKEYGRHERPHTDHHMLRSSISPGTSPGSSPTAQQAAATATAPAVEQGLPGAQRGTAPQQQGGVGWGWGWGLGIPASSSSNEGEVWHSPPSGPGFLLQQQKHQEEEGLRNTR